ERQDLRDLADELSSQTGQKKLEEQLKDLAREDDESPESRQQRELDDAENGADSAEGDISAQRPGDRGGERVPIPLPGPGGQGSAGMEGPGSTGSRHATGTGGHTG